MPFLFKINWPCCRVWLFPVNQPSSSRKEGNTAFYKSNPRSTSTRLTIAHSGPTPQSLMVFQLGDAVSFTKVDSPQFVFCQNFFWIISYYNFMARWISYRITGTANMYNPWMKIILVKLQALECRTSLMQFLLNKFNFSGLWEIVTF